MNAVDTLEANIKSLSGRDADFARDLVTQSRIRGLSSKQLYWVGELIKRASKPKPATIDNCEGIVAMFLKAAGVLKYPKIRVATEDGRKVTLTIASERSSAPGAINLSNGEPFSSNVYYGRIMPNGELRLTDAGRRFESQLLDLLAALSKDPAGTAALYGKRTGTCCFCGRSLESGSSLAVGYGPICAEKFGLSWGAVKIDTNAEIQLTA